MAKGIATESTITCPECGYSKKDIMPTDACQWFYECESCHALLKPKAGDCCVYCTYGDVPCPPIQQTSPAVNDCFRPEAAIERIATNDQS